MGACVSVYKNPDSKSNFKFRLSLGSKTDKLVIPSPLDHKPIFDDHRSVAEDGLKSGWSPSDPVTHVRDFGSKEETFFDSQAWLESDCDDDFFSVNGDFTPSRGSTPVHHNFSAGTPQINKALFYDNTPASKPEPSPTDKKKRLADLFQESFRHDQGEADESLSVNQNGANGNVESKTTPVGPPLAPRSVNGSSYIYGANSACSTERTPNGGYRPEEEKELRPVQCCVPRMLSLSERRKKMSPVRSIG